MNRLFILFFITFSSLPVRSIAQVQNNFKLELLIEYPGYGSRFEGLLLDSNGLYLARYSLKKRLFVRDTEFTYDSLLVPMSSLNKVLLYRLQMFLKAHEMLKEVRFNSEFEGDCARPIKYQLKYGQETIVVFDNEFCYDQCDNINRYIINELHILLNELIPKKYSKFRIPVDLKGCST